MGRRSRKNLWRKLGGGTLRLASGEVVYPDQVFTAKDSDIPKAFRDVVIKVEETEKED